MFSSLLSEWIRQNTRQVKQLQYCYLLLATSLSHFAYFGCAILLDRQKIGQSQYLPFYISSLDARWPNSWDRRPKACNSTVAIRNPFADTFSSMCQFPPWCSLGLLHVHHTKPCLILPISLSSSLLLVHLNMYQSDAIRWNRTEIWLCKTATRHARYLSLSTTLHSRMIVKLSQ